MAYMAKRRFHPEGVAALVAAIVAAEDVRIQVARALTPPTVIQIDQAYRAAVDYRRSQVLRAARVFYRDKPIDFVDPGNWRARAPRNGLQNLAKLDRANLRLV
jgi:hypothetical protein